MGLHRYLLYLSDYSSLKYFHVFPDNSLFYKCQVLKLADYILLVDYKCLLQVHPLVGSQSNN